LIVERGLSRLMKRSAPLPRRADRRGSNCPEIELSTSGAWDRCGARARRSKAGTRPYNRRLVRPSRRRSRQRWPVFRNCRSDLDRLRRNC